MRHEIYNSDTAKRIRRTQRNRFMMGGGVRDLAFCYGRESGATTDDRVHILPDMKPVIEGVFARLEAGATFNEVGDWLNQLGVPAPVRAHSKRWSGRLVGYLIDNTMLKGVRHHNRRMSKRNNRTGH